jgi:hypothetical protein
VNGDGQIDYREFYDLIISATSTETEKSFLVKQRDAVLLSDWLQMSGSRRLPDRLPDGLVLQAELLDSKDFFSIRKEYSNTRPLGDLSVHDVRLFPSQLETGLWSYVYPGYYPKSDTTLPGFYTTNLVHFNPDFSPTR